jgi:fumarate reductase subunit C
MDVAMSYARTPSGWVRKIGTAPAGYRPVSQPGLPPAWWRVNRRYTLYMLRELSSVFVALWSVRLLIQLDQVRRGRAAYDAAVAVQRRPPAIAFHLVTLLFATIHSVTFLIAAGKGPTVHARGRRVPERAIATGAFAGWAAASLAVLLVLLVGGRGEKRERKEGEHDRGSRSGS